MFLSKTPQTEAENGSATRVDETPLGGIAVERPAPETGAPSAHTPTHPTASVTFGEDLGSVERGGSWFWSVLNPSDEELDDIDFGPSEVLDGDSNTTGFSTLSLTTSAFGILLYAAIIRKYLLERLVYSFLVVLLVYVRVNFSTGHCPGIRTRSKECLKAPSLHMLL